MRDVITLREISDLTNCCEDAAAAWLKRFADAPAQIGTTKTANNRIANAYPRQETIQFLHRHNKIPPAASVNQGDQHLSLYELADHFKMPYSRLKKLYHERDDSPGLLYRRKYPNNCKYLPVFSLSQFKIYLLDLGLIPCADPNRITLREAAKLCNLSVKRIHELHLHDPLFPKKIGGKPFRKSICHYQFDRTEMLRYQRIRKKSRGIDPFAKVKPIELSGDLKNNVVQFLAMPSGRRQRVTPIGPAKTIRIRTEGIMGVWENEKDASIT